MGSKGELFSIPLLGQIKNQSNESLTSYFARLAEAHACLSGHLMKHIVNNHSFNKSIRQMMSRGSGIPLYRRSYLYNGISEGGEHFKNVLEYATQVNLSTSTLYPLKNLFTHWKLNAKNRKWCPVCFYDSALQECISYEHLLWTFTAVNICPIHKIQLHDMCPHCCKQNYLLAHKMRVAHCHNCGKWLGLSPDKIEMNDDSWQIFVSENINAFLEHAKHQDAQLSVKNVGATINALIAMTDGGNRKKFVEVNGLHYSTVKCWQLGKHTPNILQLIMIAYHNEVTLLDLYLGERLNNLPRFGSAKTSSNQLAVTSFELYKGRKRMTAGVKTEIEIGLKTLIHSQHRLTLKTVASITGIHILTLKKHFPRLCEQIVNQRREAEVRQKKERKEQMMKDIMKAINDLKVRNVVISERNLERYLGTRCLSMVFPELKELLIKYRN